MKCKRCLSLISVVMIFISLCSCGDSKYADMKRYLDSHVGVKIRSISDMECSLENKEVYLRIELPLDTDPSLQELDELRKALNDYMQQDGGFLEQDWYVSISIDEQMNGSALGDTYAVMANYEQGVKAQPESVRAVCLNTFWVCIDPEDISYISELTDVENLRISGTYSASDVGLLNKTIDEIRDLDNLKSLRVFPYWYEAVNNAGLECEVIEVSSDWFGL